MTTTPNRAWRDLLLVSPIVAVVLLLGAAAANPPAAQAQGADPLSVALAFGEAENAHDLERIVALFAEDAVLVNPNGTFTGRDQIRELYRAVFAGNIQAVGRAYQVRGDQITFISAATSDDFVRMGVAPLDLRIDATVRDGLIRRWVVSPTPEAAAKLQQAQARATAEAPAALPQTGGLPPATVLSALVGVALLAGGVLLRRAPLSTRKETHQ